MENISFHISFHILEICQLFSTNIWHNKKDHILLINLPIPYYIDPITISPLKSRVEPLMRSYSVYTLTDFLHIDY